MTDSVRIASVDDAAAIAEIYAPYVRDTAISFEEAPPTAAEVAERIGSTLLTHPYLVFERNGAVCGFAYAGAHRARPAYRWSTDVTVYVARQARRSGIGRALYSELLALLVRQGFHMAFAGIALPNAGSVGLHESMGFVAIGVYPEVGFKFGAWHDVGWWRRRLGDGAPAADPVAFSDLEGLD